MSRFFINRPIVAIVISIVMTIVGVVALIQLPISQYPNIVPPEIQVRANYTGADALTIEQAVATPIEQQMSGVDRSNFIQSVNANGSIRMTVNFETSNAGTQATTSAFATSITDTWHRCGFYFDGTATTSVITPYFHNGTSWTKGTAQNITLSGLEEMHIVYGVKAGPTAAAETLQIDYIKCRQLR